MGVMVLTISRKTGTGPVSLVLDSGEEDSSVMVEAVHVSLTVAWGTKVFLVVLSRQTLLPEI